MRVLLEADAVGGVWTFALSLARGLAAQGVHAEIARVGPGDPRKEAEAGAAGVAVHAVGGPLEWQPGVAGSEALRRQGEALEALAADVGADLLHTCSHAHAGRVRGLPVVHTAHSDVVSWWRAVHGVRPPASWSAYAENLRAAVRGAAALVVPSRAHGRVFAAAVGDTRPFRVIHNGIEPPPPPPEAGRGGPALRAGVFSAARFGDCTKNLGVLEEAARRLGPALRLAGTGEAEGFAEAACLGTLSRAGVQRELRSAAVYAGPARFEPFGLGVLEAAATGCALVLADQPTHRELWGGVADFVPPDDPAAWADALDRRLADPRPAGEAARKRSARYGLDATAAAYASLYGEALDRAGPPSGSPPSGGGLSRGISAGGASSEGVSSGGLAAGGRA